MVAKIQELVDGESTSIKVVSEKDSILSVDVLNNGTSITAPPKLTPVTSGKPSASGKKLAWRYFQLRYYALSLLWILEFGLDGNLCRGLYNVEVALLHRGCGLESDFV